MRDFEKIHSTFGLIVFPLHFSSSHGNIRGEQSAILFQMNYLHGNTMSDEKRAPHRYDIKSKGGGESCLKTCNVRFDGQIVAME